MMIALPAVATANSFYAEQFPVEAADHAIVADALKRWAQLNGSTAHYHPIVIPLKDRRCVMLKLEVPNVGGTPIYCYSIKTGILIEALDQVE
jgi:hypothetical protein